MCLYTSFGVSQIFVTRGFINFRPSLLRLELRMLVRTLNALF